MAEEKKRAKWTKKSAKALKSAFIVCLRTVLFLSMLALLLFAAAWLFLVKTFNAQHVSEVLAEEIQKRLQRPVVISSVDVKFINTLEVKGFRVLDTQGVPGQDLLSADSLTFRFKLLPLLDHQLVIDEIALNAPRFNIIRAADGKHNLPPLRAHQSSVYTNKSSGQKFTVSVEDWTLKDGVISYKDLSSGVTHAVYGLNMHFEQLRFDELSRFTLEMVLRNEWASGMSDMEISGTGHVNFAGFDWTNFALRSLRAQLYLFQKPVEITLDLDNLRTPFFNVKATVPAFESKSLSVFHLEKTPFSVPKSTVTAKGVLTNNYSLLKVNQFTASAADVKADGKGNMNFAKQPYTADFSVSTKPFDLKGKQKYYEPLSRYKLTGKASLSGQLVRQDGKYTFPLITIDAQQASGDIYGFLAENVTGQFRAKKDFSDLYAETSTGKLTVHKTVFDKLNLSASWRGGNLYGYIASTEVNGVPLKLSLSVNNLKSARRRIRTAMHWQHFNPMDFIDTVQDFVTVIVPLVPGGTGNTPDVTGDLAWLRNFRKNLPNFMSNFGGNISADTFSSPVLSGNRFNGEFELTGLRAGMNKLSGNIEARLEGGVVHQMEKWAEEQEALNITFQPFIIMHRMERAGSFKIGKVLKDVPFNDMAVSVSFENGQMQINNVYTVGPSISATASGWINWVSENFDIIVWTMFSNTSRSGALAENLTDESGNPALSFRISSSMLKPKVEMLRAKKTGETIRAAQTKGLQTDFKAGQEFYQGDYHAKK